MKTKRQSEGCPIPLRNILQDEHLVYLLHTKYKKEMVPHRNKVFYDQETVLPTDKDSDCIFCNLFHQLPKLIKFLSCISPCLEAVLQYTHSEIKIIYYKH